MGQTQAPPHPSCWAQDMKPAAGRGDRLLCPAGTLSSFSTPGCLETPHSLLSFMIAMRVTPCSPLENCCFQLSPVCAAGESSTDRVSFPHSQKRVCVMMHKFENRACREGLCVAGMTPLEERNRNHSLFFLFASIERECLSA